MSSARIHLHRVTLKIVRWKMMNHNMSLLIVAEDAEEAAEEMVMAEVDKIQEEATTIKRAKV